MDLLNLRCKGCNCRVMACFYPFCSNCKKINQMEITITIDASERLMAALQTLMVAQASAHTETQRQPSTAPANVIPTAQDTVATGSL